MEERHDPITRNFPREITGYIFEKFVDLHTTPIDLFDKDSERITSPGVALTLSAVCHEWRAIAFSSHRLWTLLSINLLSAGHAHGPELVQQWLKRTGDLAISVQIRQDSEHSRLWELKGPMEANAKSVMTIIDSYSAKIINLDIRRLPLSITALLTTPSTGSALQILRVGDSEHGGTITASRDKIRIFEGADTKHSPAVLFMEQWPIPPCLLNIHWSNLIDLNLNYASRVIAFEAIKLSSPRLQYLTLTDTNGLTNEDDNWLPPRSVLLPELVYLSYTEMGSSMGTSAILFNTIRVPSLASLEYHGYERNNFMPIREIIQCIQRSACSIEELLVREAEYHDFTDFLLLLQETPALESLDISLRPVYTVEPLLQKLHHVHDQPLFLPRLDELKLSAHKRFLWASFTKIWLEDGSFISEGHDIEEELKIHEERMDLKACMQFQDVTSEIEYLPPHALLAFMKIYLSTNGGVKIRQLGAVGTSLYGGIDLIEASRSLYTSTDRRQL